MGQFMEFKRHISLSENERRVLVDWGDDIFNSEALNLIWRPKEIQVVLYDQGEPKSKCGLIKQKVTVGKQKWLIAGFGGVVTPPQFRGKGYAHLALEEALHLAREEWQAEAAMLFCLPSLVPFYQSQKWQLVETDVKVYQPEGMINFPAVTMVFPFSTTLLFDTDIYIDGLPW